eukprot:scaffold203488_cov41-Tisochrysis_lutea.AAC.1
MSEKALHLPALHPVASLQVRFKVHSGSPDAAHDPDPESSLSPVQISLLESAKIDPSGRLSPEQRARVRRLLARRIAAFAPNPGDPNRTHLLEVELPLNPTAIPHRHAPSR